MSTEANKAFVQEYLRVISQDKSAAALDRYLTDEDLKHHIAMYDVALPGYTLEADQLVAEGDLVNVRGTVRGIHNGSLGEIPPTGKHVEFSLFITYRIVDGKIAEHWMLPDMLSLLQQVGAMPAPAQS
ncbi:MAG: ester cyclase [Chloroflexota bacterium]